MEGIVKPRAKVALLIDAENVSGQKAAEIFGHAETFGTVVERRAYGNFSNGNLKSWITAAPSLALDLRQTPNPVTGKNSADLLLAIEATELLCLSGIDIFCLATSDSDFTPLAMRIRGRGKQVIGLGESKTPSSYREAFCQFLSISSKAITPLGGPTTSVINKKEEHFLRMAALPQLIAEAVKQSKPADDGWVQISFLGAALRRVNPDFSAKSYGSSQLAKLLASLNFVEMRDHAKNGLQMRLRHSAKTGVLVLGERLATG